MSAAEKATDPMVVALLGRLGRRLAPEAVDELWVFPTRRSGPVESSLLVVSAFEEVGDRRRLLTLRAVARKDPKGQVEVQQELAEQGVAPTDRVGRVLDGVLRRLDDALTADPPRTFQIGGDPERWAEAVRELTGEEPGAAGAPPTEETGDGAATGPA